MPTVIGNVATKSLQSQLMKLAYDAIFEAKGSQVYLPLRTLRHVPNFDAILRPIDPDRVDDLSADSMCSGFRRNEPVYATPLMPELKLPRFILGGNHRCAAGRRAAVVLILSQCGCHPISEKAIEQMMELVEDQDPTETRQNLDVKVKRFFRCVKLMKVATQVKEPSPSPPTILQMVSLIRTFFQNDPDILLRAKKHPRAVYGGYKILRRAMFGDIPLQSRSHVHFLLNKGYVENPRHINKCLAGAQKLIETKLRKTVPAIQDNQTLLDIVLYWERRDFVPTFNVSHLCHLGELSADAALEIAEEVTEAIYHNIRNNPDQICIAEAPCSKRRFIPMLTRSKAIVQNNETHQIEETKGGSRSMITAVRIGASAASTPTPQPGIESQTVNAGLEEEYDSDDNDSAVVDEESNEEADGTGDNIQIQGNPRRFQRLAKTKRKYNASDNFKNAIGPSKRSKRRKKNNQGDAALIKKLHKNIEDEQKELSKLKAELETAMRVKVAQEGKIRYRKKEIEGLVIKRNSDTQKTTSAVKAFEDDLKKELKADFETQLARQKADADAALRKAQSALRKAHNEKQLKDRALLDDMRKTVRNEVEGEFEKKRQADKNLLKELEILQNRTEATQQASDTVELELQRLREEKEELKKSKVPTTMNSPSLETEIAHLRKRTRVSEKANKIPQTLPLLSRPSSMILTSKTKNRNASSTSSKPERR